MVASKGNKYTKGCKKQRPEYNRFPQIVGLLQQNTFLAFSGLCNQNGLLTIEMLSHAFFSNSFSPTQNIREKDLVSCISYFSTNHSPEIPLFYMPLPQFRGDAYEM